MTCDSCKYWDTGWTDTKEKPCSHPRIDNDLGDDFLVKYGGSDGGFGDYFRTDGNFGCILYEAKE